MIAFNCIFRSRIKVSVKELAKYLGSIDFDRDNQEPLSEPITWIRDDG
jgi:hypothetical protein